MIREFQRSDTEQIMALWLFGNVDAHSFIPNVYWESNFDLVKEQILQAEVYVYEVEGIIHGFIGVQEDYIAGIFVKQESRCGGIGKQLLDHVKKSHSVLTLNVYQKNWRAVNFYKREGFLVISEEEEEGSREVDETLRWYREK